jgi:Protein of unknown function (DUF2846)
MPLLLSGDLKMKKIFLVWTISLLLLLSGCTPHTLSRADNARESQAKQFSPKANLSNIYVYRPSGGIGRQFNFRVTVDGKLAGDIENGSFILLEVSPGRHTVSTSVIKKENSEASPIAEVELETDAGNSYYLWPDWGGSADKLISKLRQVDEATGRREVNDISMIWVPDNVIKSIAKNRNQPATEGKTYAPPIVSKPTKAPTERLVFMPMRVGEGDKSLQGAMETALVQGLQQNYIVFSGEQVAQKAHEIFLKESRNTAKKDCDETRCMQGIAEAFQAELIATASVTKREDGYFLALSIQNIFDNKVVYSNSLPCKNCDAYQVVDKLKELSSASAR